MTLTHVQGPPGYERAYMVRLVKQLWMRPRRRTRVVLEAALLVRERVLERLP